MALNTVKGTILAFLTELGTVGNICVFVNYTLRFRNTEVKSIPLILIHLVFTNLIMLLCKGIPRTTANFGLRNLLDDMGCKIVVYLERVAQGLSVCTSGLLTVVQATTLSPRYS